MELELVFRAGDSRAFYGVVCFLAPYMSRIRTGFAVWADRSKACSNWGHVVGRGV